MYLFHIITCCNECKDLYHLLLICPAQIANIIMAFFNHRIQKIRPGICRGGFLYIEDVLRKDIMLLCLANVLFRKAAVSFSAVKKQFN